MITATQARTNTELTRQNLIRQIKEKARSFCEEKISPLITAASKDGENHIFVDIDENVDVNEVKINLLENRFKVGPGTNPNSITVMW